MRRDKGCRAEVSAFRLELTDSIPRMKLRFINFYPVILAEKECFNLCCARRIVICIGVKVTAEQGKKTQSFEAHNVLNSSIENFYSDTIDVSTKKREGNCHSVDEVR